MQFNLNMTHRHMIKSHSDTQVTINHQTYDKSLIITPDSIIVLEAPIPHPSQLSYEDISAYIKGDLLLLGHHQKDFLHHFPLQAHLLKEKGMGLEIMTIGSACRTYNVLLGEGRPASLLIVF